MWRYSIGAVLVVGIFAFAAILPSVEAAGNSNPRILPPQSKPYGLGYGEWVAEWWTWAVSIPAAENPILDETGEFAGIGQDGPVWFLAGTFGTAAEREVTIPRGKAVFFPIFNSLWWAPDDLDDASWLAGELGYDAGALTAEELIRLIANYQVDFATSMNVTIDGIPITGLDQYRTESGPFPLTDTDLLDDLGAEISQPNFSIGAGYWLMVAPLPVGTHTVHVAVESDNPIFGPFSLDVSYDITVEREGQVQVGIPPTPNGNHVGLGGSP